MNLELKFMLAPIIKISDFTRQYIFGGNVLAKTIEYVNLLHVGSINFVLLRSTSFGKTLDHPVVGLIRNMNVFCFFKMAAKFKRVSIIKKCDFLLAVMYLFLGRFEQIIPFWTYV
jgi:hypothetical protein